MPKGQGSRVKIAKAVARTVFRDALRLALSTRGLPAEWLARTERVGQSHSQTFIALMGTALLARATEPLVDPLTFYADAEPTAGLRSYSARSVADVLVPLARASRVHLGVLGGEPLQNHPVIGRRRAEEMLERVSPADRESAAYMVQTLELIRALVTRDERVGALAAFLRARHGIAASPDDGASTAVTVSIGLDELVERSAAFVRARPEGGRRGQALVAAAMDVVYGRVVSHRVNDPSRRWPGDVLVYASARAKTPLLLIEVRQRPVRMADLHTYAERLASAGLSKGMVVALAKGQARIATRETHDEVLGAYGVLVYVFDDVAEFLRAAATWSSVPVEEFLASFAAAMRDRLHQLEASPESQTEWARLFGDQ